MLFPNQIKTAEQFFDRDVTRLIDSIVTPNEEEAAVIELALGIPLTEMVAVDMTGTSLVQYELSLN